MTKIKEIFTYSKGIQSEISNTELADNITGIPFVSCTEKNNGISAYIKRQENKKTNPGHTLSVALNGSILETFYQKTEYYSSHDLGILTPKKEMTVEEMLFYALCIKQHKIRYSYGRIAHRTLDTLELPGKIPTWVYKYKFNEIKYTKNKNKTNIDFLKSKDILLSDLFKISRGKSVPINEMFLEKGDTPIISSSEFDNGVSGYTSIKPSITVPCLTLAINGSVGACFYQETPFIATADVSVLIPKLTFNKYIAIYIATLLSIEGKLKYSYGRKISLSALEKTTIKLPMDKKDNPNWKLVEQYIKDIEKQYK